jgi:hypothetical protein
MASYATYELKGGGWVTAARPSVVFDLDAAYPSRRIVLETAQGVAALALVPDEGGIILILDERRSRNGLTLFGFDATPAGRVVLEEILDALRAAWRTERSETGGGAEPSVSPALFGGRRRAERLSRAPGIQTKQ